MHHQMYHEKKIVQEKDSNNAVKKGKSFYQLTIVVEIKSTLAWLSKQQRSPELSLCSEEFHRNVRLARRTWLLNSPFEPGLVN